MYKEKNKTILKGLYLSSSWCVLVSVPHKTIWKWKSQEKCTQKGKTSPIIKQLAKPEFNFKHWHKIALYQQVVGAMGSLHHAILWINKRQ